jgi:hypothetical protein
MYSTITSYSTVSVPVQWFIGTQYLRYRFIYKPFVAGSKRGSGWRRTPPDRPMRMAGGWIVGRRGRAWYRFSISERAGDGGNGLGDGAASPRKPIFFLETKMTSIYKKQMFKKKKSLPWYYRDFGRKTTLSCTCGQKNKPKVWPARAQPACMCGQKWFFGPYIFILKNSTKTGTCTRTKVSTGTKFSIRNRTVLLVYY